MPEQRNLILAIVLSVTIIIAFQYFYELPRIKDAQRQEAIRTEQAVDEWRAPAPARRGGRAEPARHGERHQTSAGRAQRDHRRRRSGRSRQRPDPRLVRADRRPDRQSDPVRLQADHRAGFARCRLAQPAGLVRALFRRARLGRGRPVGAGARPRCGLERRSAPSCAPASRSRSPGTTAKGCASSGGSRSTTPTCSRSRQRVVNDGDEAVSLYPYGLVSRWGTPETLGFFILHEGPIGVLNGTLEEIDYDDLQEDGSIELPSRGGWLGFTDKYWLAALVPDQASELTATFRDNVVDGQDRYQVDYLRTADHRARRRLDRDHRSPVRRRQGGRAARSLQRAVRHPAVRSRGRFRLVLFPDQAAVPRPAFLLQVDRQLRRGDPAADAPGQDHLLTLWRTNPIGR